LSEPVEIVSEPCRVETLSEPCRKRVAPERRRSAQTDNMDAKRRRTRHFSSSQTAEAMDAVKEGMRMYVPAQGPRTPKFCSPGLNPGPGWVFYGTVLRSEAGEWVVRRCPAN